MKKFTYKTLKYVGKFMGFNFVEDKDTKTWYIEEPRECPCCRQYPCARCYVGCKGVGEKEICQLPDHRPAWDGQAYTCSVCDIELFFENPGDKLEREIREYE